MSKKVFFRIFYLLLYVFLPCGIDQQCDEDRARLILYNFTVAPNNEFKKCFYSDGKNVYNTIFCNENDFIEILEKIKKETIELRNKNAADIENKVNLKNRRAGFNKRVLLIKKEQLSLVFKHLKTILGCQECPSIVFYDHENNIKDFNSFFTTCQKFFISNKKNASSKKKETGYENLINTIFEEEKDLYNKFLVNYYKDNEITVEDIVAIKQEIITGIENTNLPGFRGSDFLVKKNAYGYKCLILENIYKLYKETEKLLIEAIDSTEEEYLQKLDTYKFLRGILFRAKIINCFLYLFDNKEKSYNVQTLFGNPEVGSLDKANESFISEPSSFFFTETHAIHMDRLAKNGKNISSVMMGILDGFTSGKHSELSFLSPLDISLLLSQVVKCNNSLVNDAIKNLTTDWGKLIPGLKKILTEIKDGNAFKNNKSVLFSIAQRMDKYDENGFTNLNEVIKNYFNSVIFSYLSALFKKVKDLAADEEATYNFHENNTFIETIIAFSSFIKDDLNKEHCSEIAFDILQILINNIVEYNIESYNGVVMEIAMILDVLMEYLSYTKDLNEYTAQKDKERQETLKKVNTSNYFDSFYILSKQDYNDLIRYAGCHTGNDPQFMDVISKRMYEDNDEEDNDEDDNKKHEDDNKKQQADLKVVLMGDMRAGKTLFIRELFEEHDRFKFKVGNGDVSTTCKITHYKRPYTISNSGDQHVVEYIDTPGFEGIEENDRGYVMIAEEFENIFANDAIVVDMVLYREGSIKCLSKNHKEIIKKILEEKENKIIFLLPFTTLKKNARRKKEKFLASLFFDLYVQEENLSREQLSKAYITLKDRIQVIPINQLHSENTQESRFGIQDVAKAIAESANEAFCENEKFYQQFINNFSDDVLCMEDKKDSDLIDNLDIINDNNINDTIINTFSNNEEQGPTSLIKILKSILYGFNGFVISDNDIEDDDYTLDFKEQIIEEDYGLLNIIYKLYLGYSFFTTYIKENLNPIFYEVYKTGLYKLADLIKSPYFFNYLCLDNNEMKYNIYFFKKEIDFICNIKRIKDTLEKKKDLAKFCLLADDEYLIDEDLYMKIKDMCSTFNNMYTFNLKPMNLNINNSTSEDEYKYIQNTLKEVIAGKADFAGKEDIITPYLDFLVCYNKQQKRFILDRTNVCFLCIDLPKGQEGIYEEIPKILKDYINTLNKAIKKIENVDDLDKEEHKVLHKRYHHNDRNGVTDKEKKIRTRERKLIEEMLEAKIAANEEQNESQKNLIDNVFDEGAKFIGKGVSWLMSLSNKD